MRNTIIVTTIAATLFGSVSIASAGADGVPLKPQTDAFSAGVNHVFDLILQPLDVATHPVSDMLRPITGSVGFAGASPTMPTARQPIAASTNANPTPETAPTTASKTVPVL